MNWLTKYYLYPNSFVFSMAEFMEKHLKWILISLVIFILSYPITAYVKHYQQAVELQQEKAKLFNQLTQYKKLYHSIKEHNQQLQLQDSQISHINQQLQTVLDSEKMKLAQIQWSLDSGKVVYLSASQQVKPVFNFIEKINQLGYLKFKELELIKQNENNLLQINATLLVKGE
ncbi:hypothetical protein [[Haemophilus] ducreyi]|nr:hypothetical protein [[Haemophilus] ducreyi]AKO30511.1 hypothetical protein RY60_01700 [[Haemophilus] ducreyi]AKO31945.1 hypothetical protein RZ57_01695 [[Haemophilus] ducreyi]AKO33399.1 hypothetical protein RZ58_01700 [[Haemophilus] ducreyi]AKO34847.1 hypothetical protein RZ59_01690 [[Haemophilus] ducreyi]AKO36273.1 hypothetical protein RZ61_01675 [[Haemophilus] ducreyi]